MFPPTNPPPSSERSLMVRSALAPAFRWVRRTRERTQTVPTVVPEPQFCRNPKRIIYSTAVRLKQQAPSFLGVGKVVSLARLKKKRQLHQITLRM